MDQSGMNKDRNIYPLPWQTQSFNEIPKKKSGMWRSAPNQLLEDMSLKALCIYE
jgi:hypothetical protein